MAYFCSNYPHKSELSKARLTKLVYLADWYSSLINDAQMTDIKWLFNHYGPYVDNITDIAKFDDDFLIEREETVYGSDKFVISYHGNDVDQHLASGEIDILDAIIKKTSKMYFNEFIDFVYSTYPVSSNVRYSMLDLPLLAREYQAQLNAEAV
ncbi:Panacea domain-containing protein [Alteromonas sp. HB246098]